MKCYEHYRRLLGRKIFLLSSLWLLSSLTIFLLSYYLWPSGQGAGFPIQGSRVQNHWVAPRSTQPFIFLRSIKWVPRISGKLVVKSKLPPRSGSSLEAVKFVFFYNLLSFQVIFRYFVPLLTPKIKIWKKM